jgi:acyl carrier protein
MGVEQLQVSPEMMQELIGFITNKVIKGKSQITEDTPLVSSGLIDSFALIEIFLELQKIAGRKVPASKVQAKDMDTVRLMFATAERFGKPVKN